MLIFLLTFFVAMVLVVLGLFWGAGVLDRHDERAARKQARQDETDDYLHRSSLEDLRATRERMNARIRDMENEQGTP